MTETEKSSSELADVSLTLSPAQSFELESRHTPSLVAYAATSKEIEIRAEVLASRNFKAEKLKFINLVLALEIEASFHFRQALVS